MPGPPPVRATEDERVQRSRRYVLGLLLIAALPASCSSSPAKVAEPTTTSSPSIPTSSTVDPDLQYNAIPYNVGERIGLPNGWLVQVTRVHRPYAAPGLPSLSAGEQFVGVDLMMNNEGTAPMTVNARRIFTLTDSTGKSHAVVSGAEGDKGLDGSYASGATKSGRLVFAVPVGLNLQMLLDGPVIHTQRSVFQIDPPKTPPQD
jgi:hypothetical protein